MIVTTANQATTVEAQNETHSANNAIITNTLIEMRNDLKEDLKMIKEVKW
jgi:hypothetical protein